MRHDPIRTAPPRRLLLTVLVSLLALSGCQEEEIGTPSQAFSPTPSQTCLPFQDAGAISEMMLGTWRVRTLDKTVTLISCETPAFDGRVVSTDSVWVTYEVPLFLVLERGPPLYEVGGVADAGRERFTARIDSYDCATSATIYEHAGALWFLCEGQFAPETGRVSGICSRAEIDTNLDDYERQGTCTLSEPFFFDMEHVPV